MCLNCCSRCKGMELRPTLPTCCQCFLHHYSVASSYSLDYIRYTICSNILNKEIMNFICRSIYWQQWGMTSRLVCGKNNICFYDFISLCLSPWKRRCLCKTHGDKAVSAMMFSEKYQREKAHPINIKFQKAISTFLWPILCTLSTSYNLKSKLLFSKVLDVIMKHIICKDNTVIFRLMKKPQPVSSLAREGHNGCFLGLWGSVTGG